MTLSVALVGVVNSVNFARFVCQVFVNTLAVKGGAIYCERRGDIVFVNDKIAPVSKDIKMSTMHDLNYQTLVEIAGEMICVGDAVHFVFVNDSFTKNLGWSKEELLSMPFMDLLHPDDVSKTHEAVRVLEQGEELVKFTNRYKHKDGSWRHLEWYSRPIGELYYATARDVTSRLMMERQREQTLKLLEESLRISDSGYFLIDMETGNVLFSKEVLRILGMAPDVSGVTLSDVITCIHSDDVERVRSKAGSSLLQGEPFSIQSRMRYADSAQYKSMLLMGFPIFEAQKLVSVFGLMRDMTHDEATLRQEELELFARIASHDLRAPLRQISMFLDLMQLESDVFDVEPLKKYFEHVQSSVAKLKVLIQDLSRYVLAGQYNAMESVPVMDVLDQVLEDLNERIEAQQATIALPEQVPSVLATRSGLYHIFQNLISNALKFGQYTPELTISINAELQGSDHVLLSVADNGPGFAKEKADIVFEPFMQVDSRHLGGSGIGLSIVKRIVDRFHGDVWVNSSPDHGCTFFICLMLPPQ